MKLFIWDFHGGLEKGTEGAVLEISNRVLREFGYEKQFTPEHCLSLYGRKWYEYFEDLLPNESHERHVEIADACITMGLEEKDIVPRHIKANDHAEDVLREISKKHCQILLSNTSPNSMQVFLDAVGLAGFFPHESRFCLDNHKGGSLKISKQEALKNFMEGKNFDGIITIGDSCDDMDLVPALGGKRYLYSLPGRRFRDAEADYRINDLREVLREI